MGLDGLRFLAAASVLMFHYTGVRRDFWGEPVDQVFPVLNQVTRYGYLGVQCFFVISGFVILMTAYGRSLNAFVASRISRLYPAYWAAVVLTVALQAFWKGGRNPSVADSLLNLTMVQRAFGAQDVQGAFWTLWIELLFYILVGVLVTIGITRRRMVALAFLWPLAAQIASRTHAPFLEVALIPGYASLFALGILLFLIRREGNSVILWLGVVFNLVVSVYNAARAGSADHLSPTVISLVLVGLVAAVWAVTSGPLVSLSWKFLSTLGNLTYPVYLIHGQFGFFVISTLYPRLNRYVVLVTATTLVLLMAVALHQLVERPYHRRLRRAVEAGLDTLGVRRSPTAEPPDPSVPVPPARPRATEAG